MKHVAQYSIYLALAGLIFYFASDAVLAGQRLANDTTELRVDAFINKWNVVGDIDRKASETFINDLCDLLELDRPAYSGKEYRFYHFVTVGKPGGPLTSGCMDLYKRGSFVLMFAVDKKASNYHSEQEAHMTAQKRGACFASYLDEKPPFLLVTDAGRFIDVYADFTCNAHYTPFPAAEKNRIFLKELGNPSMQKLLRSIWLTPYTLAEGEIP